ncbi:unnamed protein product [Notodromas monacha]|uniref:Integrator complex subunit 12 n=1 Tax=Notodromas monacha TaxID=399045 RepID=A0A7R9GDA6_9CRUS|nr:unnamed protein product [Notodromas monacha]CAG0916729.1 unnamed protein product [Notodromas monacha]
MNTVAPTHDFDPVILKGFRLLMSKREESAVELRQLFEDLVAQRLTSGKQAGKVDSLKSFSHVSKTMKSVEGNKRLLEKSSEESGSSSKRLKTSEDSSTSKVSNKVKLPQTSPGSGDGDFTMDYVLRTLVGVYCDVCKKAEPTQLLECNTCKKMYHQDCHQPNALAREAYDPRNVWYCNKCKSSNTSKVKPTSSAQGSAKPASRSVLSSSDREKSLSSKDKLSKEKKASSGSSKSSKTPFVNLTAGRSTSSGSSSSHPKTALIDAQKRMENMKKKAAEKRKIL